ncbi:MAG: hypothetical protein HY822_19970 [Acidobacteria bacterium]|nr:hypothetical protein [Acidobacteriota bacterium]
MQLPRLLLVRQKFPDRRVQDIAGAVAREMAGAGFASRLGPGASVAIGVGSRGIANLGTIVRAVVDFWKSQGKKPFIFPAMGSHGAATAEGQAEVLAHYGIREATMGCPVRSSLDVVPAGRTADGIETFIDRLAFESDGIMLVARVKWHTDFEASVESGLFKMLAIGLGKFAGAKHYHTYSYRMGLETVIRTVGRQVLASGKILGGLAVLEDANHNTAQLTAVPAEGMERREEELLALVKTWMGQIPVRELDLLIVDELGKNISGAGMDTKVINRKAQGGDVRWREAPWIHRIFVRDLSDLSYDNALGIGMADITTDRLVKRIDWTPTLTNALTANTLGVIKIPLHFPTDRECLETVADTVGRFDPRELKIGWIRNTMQLSRLVFSEPLREEIEANPELEIAGGPLEIPYDADGNLADVLSEIPL